MSRLDSDSWTSRAGSDNVLDEKLQLQAQASRLGACPSLSLQLQAQALGLGACPGPSLQLQLRP